MKSFTQSSNWPMVRDENRLMSSKSPHVTARSRPFGCSRFDVGKSLDDIISLAIENSSFRGTVLLDMAHTRFVGALARQRGISYKSCPKRIPRQQSVSPELLAEEDMLDGFPFTATAPII